MLLSTHFLASLSAARRSSSSWVANLFLSRPACSKLSFISFSFLEAQESAKKLNEMKLSLEHAGLDKNKFATQLDELRRAADNEARK